MLAREDLTKLAELKKLSPKNAEKDYLLDVILYLIYSYAGKELVFKGGTALYKVYGLDRFSEDLDFTLISAKFKIEEILAKILRGLEALGIGAVVSERERFRNQINIRLALRGPFYDGRKESLTMSRINISLRERVVIPPLRERVMTAYKELSAFEVYVMDLREIMAEKVRASMTRDKARDAYDLWFISKKGIAFDEALINKKLKAYRLKFKKAAFIKKVDEKKAAWLIDLRGVVTGTIPEFAVVRKDLIGWLPTK